MTPYENGRLRGTEARRKMKLDEITDPMEYAAALCAANYQGGRWSIELGYVTHGVDEFRRGFLEALHNLSRRTPQEPSTDAPPSTEPATAAASDACGG